MGSDQCFTRLNILEVKSLIYQKIGHQRANSYLDQLGKFLTSRISKSEFDKLCIKTIGRENISLHNRLLRSILKNASVANSPPQRYPKKLGNSQIRRCRTRKFRDRPSPLGPLGKPQSITTTNDESLSKVREEGEEVEQITASPSVQSRSPLTAPFGVSFNGTRKSILRRNGETCCQSSGELPDSKTLWAQLEKRLETQGIKLSLDSANLINSVIDVFMKRLIEPCLSLATSTQTVSSNVSMYDFRAAMELNPRVLGEEWPIHLEKICSREL